MKIKLEEFSQIFKIVILFFSLPNIYSQETPLGSKIVGNGDALNYYIGHFPVNGSDGLDLHWHGGIRFGDATSTSVMQITNGNVGIGTISPSAKFHVLGANGSLLIDNVGSGENYYNATNFQEFQIGGISKMRLNSAGNLGIGTNSPLAKLHVNNGDNSYGTILANASEAEFSLYTKTLSTNGSSEVFKLGLKYLDNENNGFISFYRGGNVAGGFLGFSTNGQERIRISDAGFVGIGTSSPDSKLTVAGNIHAREVKVTMNAGAVPDYVFTNDYKLKSLEDVEAYIKKNSHLPEIPSAKEIEKNGLMLAEMNMSLLKKIEELTLYSIEQNKNNKELKRKVEKLEKENEAFKSLSERLSKLEYQSK
nr:tail fiber protein [uncultured Flavobacterium sp.]